MSHQLTNDQRESYFENGFLIIREAFNSELNRLENGIMRAINSGNCINGDRPYPTPATQYTIEGQYQDDSDLLFIAEHPKVLDPVEQLLGTTACLSAFVSYLKTPGAPGTGGDYQGSSPTGHCDYKTYQQAGSSLNWLFAIIPLTDLDEETGPLYVSPRSHKASKIYSINDRVRGVKRASASKIPPMIDLRLCRGDLLLMHMFTWHEGKGNRSNHDRFGIYNKYRAIDAPPGCGPQLFHTTSRGALTRTGQRILPHCSDFSFTEARLIIECTDKFLLLMSNEGWKLPGSPIAFDDPNEQSVTAKLISQLESSISNELYLDIPWMTYVADYAATNGVHRVFAYLENNISIAERVNESCTFWASKIEIDELARNDKISNDDNNAIHIWTQESRLWAVGESIERAKNKPP